MQKNNITPGDDHTFPKKGDFLGVHYTGTLEDGTVFDCSRKRGALFEFQVGMGGVIKGWDTGLLQFSLGERSTLRIPPNLAYGKQGAPPLIPSNATLNFDIQLFSINGRYAEIGGKKVCGNCVKVEDDTTKYKACGNCRSVYYCGRDCQAKHWPIHKKYCSKLKN